MKVEDKVTKNVKVKLGYRNVLGVSSASLSRGLIFFWKDNIDF